MASGHGKEEMSEEGFYSIRIWGSSCSTGMHCVEMWAGLPGAVSAAGLCA